MCKLGTNRWEPAGEILGSQGTTGQTQVMLDVRGFPPDPSDHSPHVCQELLESLLPMHRPELEPGSSVACVAQAVMQGPVLVEHQAEAGLWSRGCSNAQPCLTHQHHLRTLLTSWFHLNILKACKGRRSRQRN